MRKRALVARRNGNLVDMCYLSNVKHCLVLCSKSGKHLLKLDRK
jgi:hypothetical protein